MGRLSEAGDNFLSLFEHGLLIHLVNSEHIYLRNSSIHTIQESPNSN